MLVNCLLTLKLVSVCPELSVVFKVLTVVYGNLNSNLLFSGFVNFDLLLVKTEALDTSEPPTFAVNVASV